MLPPSPPIPERAKSRTPQSRTEKNFGRKQVPHFETLLELDRRTEFGIFALRGLQTFESQSEVRSLCTFLSHFSLHES